MEGPPVGIQLAGGRWEDERVIEIMKVVDATRLDERGFGPDGWEKRKTAGSAPHIFHTVSATVICGSHPRWDGPADKSPKGAVCLF